MSDSLDLTLNDVFVGAKNVALANLVLHGHSQAVYVTDQLDTAVRTLCGTLIEVSKNPHPSKGSSCSVVEKELSDSLLISSGSWFKDRDKFLKKSNDQNWEQLDVESKQQVEWRDLVASAMLVIAMAHCFLTLTCFQEE